MNELLAYLEIEGESLTPSFSCNVPRRLADKMCKGDVKDPLFLQFVPSREEAREVAGFVPDPVEDARFCKSPRLIQKYSGRVLMISTGACAMHCRFCFRQNFDYGRDFTQELEIIRADPSIHEVILSGGDPLSLSDQKLKGLLKELEHIPLIRFHTRFPIGIPERITDDFLNAIEGPSQKIFVLHVNHPRELDEDVFAALAKVQKAGIPILTQSVLLKGVNDSADILRELFLSLASHGIIPYYLHQLDRVTGTAHFEVPIEKGLRLIDELKSTLPGYCVPRYVQDIPGSKYKSLTKK